LISCSILGKYHPAQSSVAEEDDIDQEMRELVRRYGRPSRS
jgi:hypothetical protein